MEEPREKVHTNPCSKNGSILSEPCKIYKYVIYTFFETALGARFIVNKHFATSKQTSIPFNLN